MLPQKKLFMPDISNLIGAAYPFIMIVNFVIGIFGLWLLSVSGWHMILAVKGLFTGTSSWKSFGMRFLQILVGVTIIFGALTATWYDIFVFLWEKVATKAIENFNKEAPKDIVPQENKPSGYLDQFKYAIQYGIIMIKGV
ncbi:hypothetical protein [Thermotalea metallivorans]|uniref:Uncharacterized protein n=1 Tax=Thermotalea metallivorans TaxID=520762 RepID=A0A140L9Z4_9FIRM|nr:hypothetical protein [Thermotalea metallivorans]KXG77369.1 hypothetical protein AN619_04950 [Thermotalea metallivorans]